MDTSKHTSRYWDDFDRRIDETTAAIQSGKTPPLRRIALHITSKCNFNCEYCNEKHLANTLPEYMFIRIVNQYSDMGGGILHITGGEPTTVKWLQSRIIHSKPKNVIINPNTNCYKLFDKTTYQNINRIKISLDSYDARYFDTLVNKRGAFDNVVSNIWKLKTYDKTKDTSITFTLTKENYRHIPAFLDFYYTSLPPLYAAFFSIYKGTNPRFVFSKVEEMDFWNNVWPSMKELFYAHNDHESLWLFEHSYNSHTLNNGIRYAENHFLPCYISKSELTINEQCDVWRCSHLFRDKVEKTGFRLSDHSLKYIHEKLVQDFHNNCLYGCNLKLIKFNQEVERKLYEQRQPQH